MGEGAAEQGRNAEERKSAVGDVEGVEALGFGQAGEIDPGGVIGADILKGLILFAVDEVVGGGHVEVGDVDTGGGVPDSDEFGGAGIGKRLEKDALENAKDDSVAANARGERDERDGSEQRSVREATEDLLQLVEKAVHPCGLPGWFVTQSEHKSLFLNLWSGRWGANQSPRSSVSV